MAKAKLVAGVDCNTLVRAGMKLVLGSRLEEMCAFRNAALDWSDPAGVHDMRVASRRLRGALQDFAPYLEKRRLASSLKQIKHIAGALGQVRDHDVAIMTLERTAAKAPAKVSRGIRQFAELRNSAREELRAKFLPVLDPEALRQLTTKFTKTLDAQAAPNRRKNITYREVARSIILDRLNDLEKLSNSLYHPLKIKPLHEMRIAAKHLRYALELFEQCWGPQVSSFAQKVAGLQSSLGKLHDCDMWIEDFGNAAIYEEAPSEQSPKDSDHKTTVVWLLTHFVGMRAKHLSEAMAQWHEWETNDFGAQLRQALS